MKARQATHGQGTGKGLVRDLPQDTAGGDGGAESRLHSIAQRKQKAALRGVSECTQWTRARRLAGRGKRGRESAYIVGRSNRDTILKRMPAHVQNLLVKVDLVGVGLLAHPRALSGRCRASSP